MPERGPVVIEAGHSHLYPGATCRILDLDDMPAPCLVVFADGATVGGQIAQGDEGLRLDVGAYRTARGRAIAARSWCLAALPDGRIRVAARLDVAQFIRPGAPPTRRR